MDAGELNVSFSYFAVTSTALVMHTVLWLAHGFTHAALLDLTVTRLVADHPKYGQGVSFR